MKKSLLIILSVIVLSNAKAQSDTTYVHGIQGITHVTYIEFSVDSANQTALNKTYNIPIDTTAVFEIGAFINIPQIDPTVKGSITISLLSGGVILPFWVYPIPFRPKSNLAPFIIQLNKGDVIQVKVACVGLNMLYRWYLQGRIDK